MSLDKGKENIQYKIKGIKTKEQDMEKLLFTLGCYTGEPITIINTLASNMIIHIKDARYSIDIELAKAILI